MKKSILIGMLLIALCQFTIQHLTADEAKQTPPIMVEQWRTAPLFNVPESVLHDASADILYVSNISGKPMEKNGRGFISKVSLDGQIEVLKWSEGLNAPKGMAICKDRLFVSDIDHLVEISLLDGKIMARYLAPGAIFLNDVAADAAGNLYVTDTSSKNSVIYRFIDNNMTVWIRGADIKRPNGLFMEKERLLVGNSGDGCIKAVHLRTRQVETIASVGSGIDGLHPDGKGNYIVSDWKGRTSLVTAAGKVVLLMDTTDSKVNSADLEYVIEKELLVIPTFFDNRLVAYMIK